MPAWENYSGKIKYFNENLLTVTGNGCIIKPGGLIMAMGNAERQAKYRAGMRAKGKTRRDEWIFYNMGLAETEGPGRWPSMTRRKLNEVIENEVSGFTGDDAFLREVIYGEIAAYVKKARARYEKYNERAKAVPGESGRNLVTGNGSKAGRAGRQEDRKKTRAIRSAK
jgi:hypothetical protein